MDKVYFEKPFGKQSQLCYKSYLWEKNCFSQFESAQEQQCDPESEPVVWAQTRRDACVPWGQHHHSTLVYSMVGQHRQYLAADG